MAPASRGGYYRREPAHRCPEDATTMKVVIADDEPLARERLRLLLAEHPDLQLVPIGSGRNVATPSQPPLPSKGEGPKQELAAEAAPTGIRAASGGAPGTHGPGIARRLLSTRTSSPLPRGRHDHEGGHRRRRTAGPRAPAPAAGRTPGPAAGRRGRRRARGAARLRRTRRRPGAAGYRNARHRRTRSRAPPGRVRAAAGGGVLHRLRRARAVGVRGPGGRTR